MAAFIGDAPAQLERVYDAAARARLAGLTALKPGVLSGAGLAGAADADYLFSTWGMPALDGAAWRRLPRLKAVFYAAGSVQGFARPLLAGGVRVFSAWEANAAPVAQYCLAQILLAGKGFLARSRALHGAGPAAWAPGAVRGNRSGSVALLGAGKVAQALIGLMKPFHLKVLVYDPFLTPDQAGRLGVEKVTWAQAFSRAQVLSNHLPDLAETRGSIDAPSLASLPPGACFINTGRGASVDEAGLWRVLAQRPDLTAVLDVCASEPPEADSPAYRLPNVFLSPHLAGSLGDELPALAHAMIDELEALLQGRAPRAEVTLEQLSRLA